MNPESSDGEESGRGNDCSILDEIRSEALKVNSLFARASA